MRMFGASITIGNAFRCAQSLQDVIRSMVV
jgi:hypothetical protein